LAKQRLHINIAAKYQYKKYKKYKKYYKKYQAPFSANIFSPQMELSIGTAFFSCTKRMPYLLDFFERAGD